MFSITKKKFIQIGLSFLLFFILKGLGAQTEISLHNINWKYIKQDGANFSFVNMDDNSWERLPKKGFLYAEDTDRMWLRARTFISTRDKRLTLLLEKICAKYQVYLNGQLLPEEDFDKIPSSRCPRHVLHPIPLSLLATETGESTIAIRLVKEKALSYLSIQGKVAILPIEKAESYLWRKYLWSLVFGFLSLVLALFFLAAYKGLQRRQEYYSFSIFLFVYAFYKFSQNEMLYSVTGFLPIYEHLAQFFFMLLPALFYIFYISFFSIKNFSFAFWSFRIDKDAESLGNSYLLLSMGLALLSSLSPNLSQYFKIHFIWILLQMPFFIYYFFTALQKMKQSLRESSSFLIGIALSSVTFLYSFLTGKDPAWNPQGGMGIFLLELSISIGLLYILVQRKLEVEKHNTYLKSIDELQHRIFGYIGSILAKPTEQITSLMKELAEKKNRQKFSEELSQLRIGIKNIQNNLDSLMELARLEVLNEPEHVDEINLYDFTQVVFANTKLNCHLRVDPGTSIETGLDLMNSSMLYLVDFLTQQEFRNIDLVVNLQGVDKILFHFLAFHDDAPKAREVYGVCNHLTPLRDPRWIKWSIISEIIRIMKGKISLKRIRGHFLRVSITLPRTLQFKENTALLEKTKVKQKAISLLYKDLEEGDSSSNEGKKGLTREESQGQHKIQDKKEEESSLKKTLEKKPFTFHSQMSLGELFTLLKYKFSQAKKK